MFKLPDKLESFLPIRMLADLGFSSIRFMDVCQTPMSLINSNRKDHFFKNNDKSQKLL